MGLAEDTWRGGRNVTDERLDRVLQVSGLWVPASKADRMRFVNR